MAKRYFPPISALFEAIGTTADALSKPGHISVPSALLRHLIAAAISDLEIDEELGPGGLHHRQVGRLLAPENPSDVDAALTKIFPVVGAIAHQPARLRKLAAVVNRRDCVPGSQRENLITPVHEGPSAPTISPPTRRSTR